MGAQPLPYEAFGSWILFRKLEDGALSELWRAGKIEGEAVVGTYALRRFRHGDPQALRQSALAARGVVRQIEGTSVVREAVTDVAESTPFVAHAYEGGRSLRGILDRATDPAAPHPLPIDQALAIAERITASAQYLQGIKLQGNRLIHGALIPQTIWITEDGEVRVAGQQMAKGILASLTDPAVREEIGPYVAPEVAASGQPTAAGDIYSIGALLYLMLTGTAPPVGSEPSALEGALASATLAFDEEPLPDDIKPILQRSLQADPGRRFASFDELHQSLAKLVASGRYAPTTFNLAFYLHTLLKREMEEETQERKKEESFAAVPYVHRPKEPVPPAPADAPQRAAVMSAAAASPLSAPGRKSKRIPPIAAGVILALAAGAGAFWLVQSRRDATEAAAQTLASTTSIASAPEPPAETPMLVAVADQEFATETVVTTTASDTAQAAAQEEARRKAFEAEVNRRLREEVSRLQADYERQLAAERAKSAPRQEPSRPELARETPASQQAATPAPATTTSAPEQRLDADRLNQQRLDQIERARTETAGSAPPTTTIQPSEVPAVSTAAATTTQPAPAEVPPPAPAVREGDLIELGALDRQPSVTRSARPEYPALARRQRIEATLILSVLVSENGDVLEAKILRGDSRRLGFDEAALRGARELKFTPPMKDGQRVRTWIAFPVRFELPR